MKIQVELNAFQEGRIREVIVPDRELKTTDLQGKLERIFYWGQNDFQPVSGCCSVSVGDIIRYNGDHFLVEPIGFKKLTEGEYRLIGAQSELKKMQRRK